MISRLPTGAGSAPNRRRLLATAFSTLLVATTLVFASGPASAAVCVDTDGDGWGWDGTASCKIDEAENVCVDTDGDGWGWDGSASCRVDQAGNPSAPCVDTDGDGWGWDGIASCKVDVPDIRAAKGLTQSVIQSIGRVLSVPLPPTPGVPDPETGFPEEDIGQRGALDSFLDWRADVIDKFDVRPQEIYQERLAVYRDLGFETFRNDGTSVILTRAVDESNPAAGSFEVDLSYTTSEVTESIQSLDADLYRQVAVDAHYKFEVNGLNYSGISDLEITLTKVINHRSAKPTVYVYGWKDGKAVEPLCYGPACITEVSASSGPSGGDRTDQHGVTLNAQTDPDNDGVSVFGDMDNDNDGVATHLDPDDLDPSVPNNNGSSSGTTTTTNTNNTTTDDGGGNTVTDGNGNTVKTGDGSDLKTNT